MVSCIAAAAGLLLTAAPGVTPARAATTSPAPGTSAATANAVGLSSTGVCGAARPGHVRCLADISTHLGRVRSNAASAGPLPGTYTPSDLTSAYGLASASRGTGHRVAVVVAYDDPSAEADLGVYRSQFSLAPCTTSSGCFRKVDQNGGTLYPAPDAGWATEASLDLDMVSATCPLCSILLVEASSDALADIYQAVREAMALGATEVNLSLGSDEHPGQQQNDALFNHPGVAVVASSGDSGYGVQYPAASPYVTAVGGTSLRRSTGPGGWSETAWSGGGSGCSAYETKPSWQTDTGCARRTVADVSAVADPNTGVAVYDTYAEAGWMALGGTSVSAPIVAGSYALSGASGTGGSALYQRHAAVSDVVSGSNGTCTPGYLCTAQPGYDGPTGMGSIRGTPFATLSSSANPSAAGGTVTFTATVTPATATGTVTFNDGSTTLGSAALSSGAAALTTSALAAGTHSITAVYAGDLYDVTSVSPALTQTVSPAGVAPADTVLRSSANPSTTQQPITFTATVSVQQGVGAPTGTVAFSEGPTTLGTGTLVNGSAAYVAPSLSSGVHSITARYSGDTLFTSATSPVVSQRVSALDNQHFVGHVYQDLLGRPADAAGLAYWSGRIDSGQPRHLIAANLTGSTEYRGLQVQALYWKYLQRQTDGTPSSGGEGFWVGYIAGGATFEQLAESLIGSDEYFHVRGHDDNATYVSALYNDILGRGPEADGLAYWVGRLDAGAARYLVSASILSSTEGYQNLVRSVFQSFLGHQPDPGGLAYWTGLAQSGLRDEVLIASIIATDEYFSRP